jgi:transcriptional regulator with XRE-family HTH domain
MKKADRAIPNYRLIEERKQRNWSQRDLADRIGTTTINVCRWERGITQPGRYFRDRLCELFGRSARDLGLFQREVVETRGGGAPYALADPDYANFPASLHMQAWTTTPEDTISQPYLSSSFWYMSYRRNPFFTGREEILAELSSALDPDKNALRILPPAITGPGGIGKTQVAVEYAYRYRNRYRAVLWINATSCETLLSDFAAIAARLHLSQGQEQSAKDAVRQVLHWLEGNSNWLLILDNVADFPMINSFLPCIQAGQVLFVTRSRALGPFARCIDMGSMSPAEGALLLLRRAKLLAPSASIGGVGEKQATLAMQISQLLGGLPLALDQAGAYIEESTCDLSDFLAHYQTHRAALLNRRGSACLDHPDPVTRTYSLIVEQLEQTHPRAATLLRLCAFLAPAAIPEEIIRQAVSGSGRENGMAGSDSYAVEDAINELYRRSLLPYHAEARTYSIHPLVQIALRDCMEPVVQREWIEHTLHTVSRCFAGASERRDWQLCQRCLPHVNACIASIEQWGINSPDARSLLHHMKLYAQQCFIPD